MCMLHTCTCVCLCVCVVCVLCVCVSEQTLEIPYEQTKHEMETFCLGPCQSHWLQLQCRYGESSAVGGGEAWVEGESCWVGPYLKQTSVLVQLLVGPGEDQPRPSPQGRGNTLPTALFQL